MQLSDQNIILSSFFYDVFYIMLFLKVCFGKSTIKVTGCFFLALATFSIVSPYTVENVFNKL